MSDTEENNILVIGNGFDLYHGLNTKYIHFVEFTRHPAIKEQNIISLDQFKKDSDFESAVANNPFIKCFQLLADVNDGWIDCEDTIHRIVELLDEVLNKREGANEGKFSTKGLSKEKTEIIKIFERYFVSTDTTSPTMRITDEFRNGFGEFDKKKFFDSLKKDLDNTIEILRIYLKLCANDLKVGRRSNQLLEIHISFVVNFNYTNTISKIYGIEDEDVFYIHGSLDNNPNNMVFGIPDDDEENLDFVYFKKYFQRIQKRTGILDESRFACRNRRKKIPTNVYFFGHSLSITDGDIIKKILDLSDKIIIYYRDQPDYEEKVINILRVFGKKIGTEMIQNRKIEFIEISKSFMERVKEVFDL